MTADDPIDESSGLQIGHEGDLLKVRANGRYVLENMEAAFQAIARAAIDHPVKAALIDLRGITGQVTFMDRFKLGESAGRHLTMIPIAAVVREDHMDPGKIGKMVAVNRGAKVEVFVDLGEARQWLDQIKPPHKPTG